MLKFTFFGTLYSCSYLCSERTKGFCLYGTFNHTGTCSDSFSWRLATEHRGPCGWTWPHAPGHVCTLPCSRVLAVAGSSWRNRHWRSREHEKPVLMPAVRRQQQPLSHAWDTPEKTPHCHELQEPRGVIRHSPGMLEGLCLWACSPPYIVSESWADMQHLT